MGHQSIHPHRVHSVENEHGKDGCHINLNIHAFGLWEDVSTQIPHRHRDPHTKTLSLIRICTRDLLAASTMFILPNMNDSLFSLT